MHVSNLFTTAPMVALAQRLADRSLGEGSVVFFANSGAEANEAAIKLVRKARRGGGLVVAHGGFHGRTYGALSATPQEAKQAPFAPLVPGFDAVMPRAAADAVDGDTAGVVLELIQGESGVHPLEPSVVEDIRAACDEHGALLILDEVQTGVGRSGAFFAWQTYGIRPDAVTLAKGLANGLPIGALLVADDAPTGFAPGDHASTFGGNPVPCAAACAVVETIDDQLLAHVQELSAQLADGLRAFGEVRGLGLLLAVELDRPAAPVVEAALEHGLVIGSAGECTLRLTPPLTLTAGEAERGLELLGDVLA
jgi:acetylornithine aminotransferase/acetylornithine/N-succinyldiaminopimelate aminotransferase